MYEIETSCTTEDINQILKWLENNIETKWQKSIKNMFPLPYQPLSNKRKFTVLFENEKDALYFKLVWG